MKSTLARWATDVWYKDAFLGILLLPLAYVFLDIVRLRRFLYQKGILKSFKLPVPVIVVGNITVGGTGKTPLVIWLAEWLKSSGYKPGIISRGFGGQAEIWPQTVNQNSQATQVGDEAVLLALRTNLPIVVGPARVEAAKTLLEKFDCNIVISDDGLQHYKLRRDIEIAVIDSERRFGNGYCLPAGPLREPIERLSQVDFVVANGEIEADHEFVMRLVGNTAINLLTKEQKPLHAFKSSSCYAIAGIGNPERFFKLLKAQELSIIPKSFPDHYAFDSKDLQFADELPILMTEKDAVKCCEFATENHWYVPVNAHLESTFGTQLLNLLHKKL